MQNVDMQEVIKRALKYFIEGLAIAIAAFAIPKRQLKMEEVAMIAMAGAATFAVLDMFAPEVASGARTGAGFAIGGKHAGGF
jgi:cell division protein FtsW (lipid II flippase)